MIKHERATELLADLLNCGYADLEIILNSRYPMCDIIEYAKEFSDKLNVNDLIYSMIQLGINDIEDYINEFGNDIIESLPKAERAKFEEIEFEPHEDIEVFTNFMDSHAYINSGKREYYEKYFMSAIKIFEHKTGLYLR